MSRFKAVTWNVYHGTDAERLEKPLQRQLNRGVGLFLMNEAGDRGITQMLRERNLETYNYDQWRIAWVPEWWVEIYSTAVLLSTTPFSAKGGRDKMIHAARTILCDREGRSLDVVSYHTPAAVQRKDPPERRYKGFVESMIKLGDMAEDSECRGWLAGGDDNWDEDSGRQSQHTRPIFLGNETGLRQLQAGEPTFGKREIDDFRIKRGGGIRPVPGAVWVERGGGDEKPAHKIHGREFRWVS